MHTYSKYREYLSTYYHRSSAVGVTSEYKAQKAYIRTAVAMATTSGRLIKGNLAFLNDYRASNNTSNNSLSYTANEAKEARKHIYTALEKELVCRLALEINTNGLSDNNLTFTIRPALKETLDKVAVEFTAIDNGVWTVERVFAITDMLNTMEAKEKLSIGKNMLNTMFGHKHAQDMFNVLLNNKLYTFQHKHYAGLFSTQYSVSTLFSIDAFATDGVEIQVNEEHLMLIHKIYFDRLVYTQQERIEQLEEVNHDVAIEAEHRVSELYKTYSTDKGRDLLDGGYVDEVSTFMMYYYEQINLYDGSKDFAEFQASNYRKNEDDNSGVNITLVNGEYVVTIK